MTRNDALFYHVLKPGRYLGGEFELTGSSNDPDSRSVVWYYPDRYERAITDPSWRRSFFQISGKPGIGVHRAVEYARDVWQSLASTQTPAFTLDGLSDLTRASVVVFWAPDILTAAHIPSIVRRSGLNH